jgi:hypothetical protein
LVRDVPIVKDMTTGDDYEGALRSLPEAHSLALRLQDAGVADEVICGYLDIEKESLSTLLDLAHRKLDTAMRNRRGSGSPTAARLNH